MTGPWKPARVLSAVLGIAVVIVAAVLGLRTDGDSEPSTAGPARTSAVHTSAPGAAAVPVASQTAAPPTKVAGVPEHAYSTLVEIDAGRWPDSANAPGTKGGERWMNRGGDLPRSDPQGRAITYQEWDVNPKQQGRSRDAERIVTGSDGSAWYTGDHYATFTRMR
ncbi:ribonuclease domain-containing protein [Nocardia takedensis]